MKLTDEDGKHYEFQIIDGNRTGILKEREPKLKKIDMSVCIESGILCDMTDCNLGISPTISSLLEIKNLDGVDYYFSTDGRDFNQCAPLMNGHIHAKPKGWDKCPIPQGFEIKAYTFNNEILIGDSSKVWDLSINMFEVTGYVEGYET